MRPASVHFICLIADVDSVLANIFIFLHCQIGFILLRGNIVFDVLMINPIEKSNVEKAIAPVAPVTTVAAQPAAPITTR